MIVSLTMTAFSSHLMNLDRLLISKSSNEENTLVVARNVPEGSKNIDMIMDGIKTLCK